MLLDCTCCALFCGHFERVASTSAQWAGEKVVVTARAHFFVAFTSDDLRCGTSLLVFDRSGAFFLEPGHHFHGHCAGCGFLVLVDSLSISQRLIVIGGVTEPAFGLIIKVIFFKDGGIKLIMILGFGEDSDILA